MAYLRGGEARGAPRAPGALALQRGQAQQSQQLILLFLIWLISSLSKCRVQYAGYSVTRPEGDTGKYKSIPHHHRGEVQFLGRQVIFLNLVFNDSKALQIVSVPGTRLLAAV